jgi:lysozyme
MMPQAARRLVVGVDVSSFQGQPRDWTGVAGRFSWAAVKITELEPDGTRYVNPDAAADWSWLHGHGKGRIAYLYGHPSVSAEETVSFFAHELRNLRLRDRDGIALDLETTDGRSPSQVDAWALAVLRDLASRLHRTPLIYTFLSFAEAGNTARLGHYPLWIADPSSRKGHPRVPAPWKTWAIHQYVITGPIDRDVANYASERAMFDHLGKPEEPDMLNLGGNIAGTLASARWPSGVTVVAGLGRDGFIQATRYERGKWSGWSNVSPSRALGAPALVSFAELSGHLYYTDTSGEVIELTTTNAGKTWD